MTNDDDEQFTDEPIPHPVFNMETPGADLFFQMLYAPNRDCRAILAQHAILVAGDQGDLTDAAKLAAEALEAGVVLYRHLATLLESDDRDRALQMLAQLRAIGETKYELWVMTAGAGSE